jgi:uncharacterized protein Yka (UPF0111/DUF47 family)
MIKKLLSFLLPKEDKFFRLIEGLAEQAQASAHALRTCVESADAGQRAEAAKQASHVRSEAKKLSTEVTNQLCLTFITPFDREDIQDLTRMLYKITKTGDKICDRLTQYDLGNDKDDFSEQSELIIQEATAMRDLVYELTTGHGTKRIMDKVDVLYDLEHRGDAVLSSSLEALFKKDLDARGFILRKDIFDMLEKVIDRYRDAAAVALQIVLKHS